MKEYTVEFEDVVKYKFKIIAEDEQDAKRIVNRMETYEFANYEVDRNEHTPTKIINNKMECNICSVEMEEDDKYHCVVCGSVICSSCISEELIIYVCKKCME